MQSKNKSIKHWIVLLVCCGMSVTSIGLVVNTGGVFFTPVSQSLGVMRGTFSFHSTINLIGTAIMSLFVPKLLRIYRYKALLIVGILGTAIPTFLMAFSQSVSIFYLLSAVRGLSVGLYGMVPLTMIVNEWFDKNHGLATGMVLGSSGVAGAVFSPIFTSLIESIGWQNSYMVLAGAMILFCIPAIVYPHSPTPREDGLLPYGFEEEPEKAASRGFERVDVAKISLVSLVLFSIFALFNSMITGVPHHFPGFAESLGLSASIGATMLSAGMIANVVSKLGMGFISDRIGPYKATLTMILINVLATFILMAAGNVWMLIGGAFLFGSIFAISTVGKTLLTKEFYGVANYAKAYPVISFVGTFGGAMGMSLVGYIYDFTGSYRTAFLITLVFQAVNLGLLFYFVRQSRVTAVNEKQV